MRRASVNSSFMNLICYLLFICVHDIFNNKRLNGGLKIKTSIEIRNEYFTSFSTDKPQSAQVSEDLSRVSDCADTCLALDKSGDTATFDYRLMNENNNEKALNTFDKSVHVIGG
jgi:hypothetical protein